MRWLDFVGPHVQAVCFGVGIGVLLAKFIEWIL